MSTPANTLTAELLIEIPRRFPNIRVWRNNRVDAMVPGRNGKMRRVQAGIDGQADLSGIIGPQGTRLEIEIKAGRDKQSSRQIAFQEMIEIRGGVYIIAGTVEGCMKLLEMSGGGIPRKPVMSAEGL